MTGDFRAELAIRPAPLNINRKPANGISSHSTNGMSNGTSTNGISTNGTPTNGATGAIPIANGAANRFPGHKHARSSYSDSPFITRNNSFTFRPAKRSMATPAKTIAVVNASGRQAASLIRYATAVGYHVRAQMRNRLGVVATEVATNENVTVFEGELYTRLPRTDSQKAKGSLSDHVDVTRADSSLPGIGVNYDLIHDIFRGAQLAFINTTFYGDEVKIGEALADAAKKAGIQHYVYSSMPDHQAYNPEWPSLPLWATKHQVEEYIQEIGLPATFVYTGIYNNNFTSLSYPLFCMHLRSDGSFLWEAPFHPDAKLPWLDAEHDVGPAILQVFKDGVTKWGGGKRIALAYEMLSPREACQLFARGVGRPVRYKRRPIELKVPIPDGYRTQLKALEQLFFFGGEDPKKQPPYFGSRELEDDVPKLAMELWEGPRGIEEYAREVFPLEEQANGLTWMFDEEDDTEDNDHNAIGPGGIPPSSLDTSQSVGYDGDINDNDTNDNEDDEDEDGLVMRVTARDDEEWLP
ncbi:nitrogen metabolite repression regulator [Grosmannia clavigera kw1407]|uniref:Nitrogen metabolite repression regulator n=1 Tax=Grosmannia clavigera (strain kw1407 / UAMH 11150) TaxID=655863 RepID=F0XHA5_GROCL|nr:nitrogen metabolite repression regulator [Grosmannia clavigera kw1407]EFX02766.1 nitrogen metabolite repression regulator [Grosmannia clavigera kw1407]